MKVGDLVRFPSASPDCTGVVIKEGVFEANSVRVLKAVR